MSNPFFKQGAAAPRNPMQMVSEFRKFAANMTKRSLWQFTKMFAEESSKMESDQMAEVWTKFDRFRAKLAFCHARTVRVCSLVA